jgi:hypothetical protein
MQPVGFDQGSTFNFRSQRPRHFACGGSFANERRWMYELAIVDDEETIRKGLETTVDWKSLGFRVAGVFGRDDQVLALARASRLDVIFADITVPGHSTIDRTG